MFLTFTVISCICTIPGIDWESYKALSNPDLDPETYNKLLASCFNSKTTWLLFFIQPPILLSFCFIFLGLTDGKKPKFSDMFSGFAFYLKSVGLLLLQSLFVFLWTLLFIIPGVIKSISYSQAFYILADNPNMRITEALNKSKQIMDGHKWEFTVLMLSFIGWGCLVLITCGIASLWVGPYLQATSANYYAKLTRRPVKSIPTVEEEPKSIIDAPTPDNTLSTDE
jgi:uncharacterized membrane protein